MSKVYGKVELPAWMNTTDKNRLLDHIKYLTHERDKYKKLYDKKLRELRKLKKEEAETE